MHWREWHRLAKSLENSLKVETKLGTLTIYEILGTVSIIRWKIYC